MAWDVRRHSWEYLNQNLNEGELIEANGRCDAKLM
jgi:hypothetical protein